MDSQPFVVVGSSASEEQREQRAVEGLGHQQFFHKSHAATSNN